MTKKYPDINKIINENRGDLECSSNLEFLNGYFNNGKVILYSKDNRFKSVEYNMYINTDGDALVFGGLKLGIYFNLNNSKKYLEKALELTEKVALELEKNQVIIHSNGINWDIYDFCKEKGYVGQKDYDALRQENNKWDLEKEVFSMSKKLK
jgi:hypothetical protein